MADDTARLVPEDRIDAAIGEIAEIYDKLATTFVSAYDAEGNPLVSATPDTAARIWAALYAGAGAPGRAAPARTSAPTSVPAAPAGGQDGRSAYCSCECGCWRNMQEGDFPTACCDCMDGNRPCGCRGMDGEVLRKVGRYTRWVPASADAFDAAPAAAPASYAGAPPPTDDDLPFE